MAAPAEQSTVNETVDAAPSEQKEADDKANEPPIKPGLARNIKLYLVDPERFVIEWRTPKRMGHPLPLRYDIVINNHPFEGVLVQHDRPKEQEHRWRVLVANCDIDEVYKVGVDTLNERVKGKQSAFQSIKTVLRPSVLTDLRMSGGVIRWKPPLYRSYGDLCYELIDADDHDEVTVCNVLFSLKSFRQCQLTSWRLISWHLSS